MKTLLYGPYTSAKARDRFGATLKNRHPGARIIYRQHGPGFYIEHYHCYQVINSERGILPLEQWVQWHKAQRVNRLKGLSSKEMVKRYWTNYVVLHGGVQPQDSCVRRMTSSWPPKEYGSLPTLGYLQAASFSSRGGAKITGITLHESQGSYASLVNWFRNPVARVSAHLCIREDGGHATQMVPYANAAWHAKNTNSWTIGIEFAGYVATDNDPRQIANGARIVAFLCEKYNIPIKRADNRGRNGIATHRQLMYNDHTDPDFNGPLKGDGFPAFLERVRTETSIGKFPASYGR